MNGAYSSCADMGTVTIDFRPWCVGRFVAADQNMPLWNDKYSYPMCGYSGEATAAGVGEVKVKVEKAGDDVRTHAEMDSRGQWERSIYQSHTFIHDPVTHIVLSSVR